MNGKGLCPFANIEWAGSSWGMPISPAPWKRVECIKSKCELWIPELRGETVERDVEEEVRKPYAMILRSFLWVEPAHCGFVPASREYPVEEEHDGGRD